MHSNIEERVALAIDRFGQLQLSDELMAAQADCLVEEFNKVLQEHDYLKRRLTIERLKGQVDLEVRLWKDLLNGRDEEVHKTLLKKRANIVESVAENVTRFVLEGLSSPELLAKAPDLCVKFQEELLSKSEK